MRANPGRFFDPGPRPIRRRGTKLGARPHIYVSRRPWASLIEGRLARRPASAIQVFIITRSTIVLRGGCGASTTKTESSQNPPGDHAAPIVEKAHPRSLSGSRQAVVPVPS